MMEKGSFHTSNQWIDNQDERVKHIPLPNQLPKGLDFSEIAPNAIKSSTIETLINQNEDLMARLTVILRKNNELEDKVGELETENKAIRARFETIKDQFMVLQEKDRMSVGRALQLTDENKTLKTQVEKLERLYADVFIQAQTFQRRLTLLERHRARARQAAKGLQKKAKHLLRAEQELSSTREELQTLRQVWQAQHMQVINNYEAKLADVKSEIDTLRGRASDRDTLLEEKLKLENTLVFTQRQNATRMQEYQETIDSLQSEGSSVRQELKKLIVEHESQSQEVTKLRSENQIVRREQDSLVEQVESLQALWNHKQKEFEQAEEKNRSLQKLNQNISITLNQQRKEIQNLQTELDKERFAFSEKIKTLSTELQMLRRQIKSD